MRVIEIGERTERQEDRFTMDAKNKLDRAYNRCTVLFQIVLERRIEVLGEDDTDTLATKRELESIKQGLQ